MRILITGATGFAGGWLAQELATAYPNATLYGMSYHTTEVPAYLPPSITLRTADLATPDSLQALVSAAEPDVVFHLAGFASGAGTDRERIFRINVEGTVRLLELLAGRKKPCRVLIASSGYVYGATNPEHPAQETDPLQAKGAYAESKAAMEIAVRPFAEGDSLALTVVRSFNHTGARQTPEFVVPGFARQIARIEKNLESPTVRHGNLEAVRDFLDVRDVVRAYRQLVLETESEPWRVVNICSGQGVVIGSLLEQLIALAKVAVAQETDPERMRPSDLPVCVGSYRRLQQYTGWEPQIPLTETLRTTLDYWRTTISQEAQV